MALRKNFTFNVVVKKFVDSTEVSSAEEVVEYESCYIKVRAIHGGKQSLTAEVEIAIGGSVKIKTYDFVPNLEGENFIAQAYEHLKTLDEFANATDC